MPCSEFLLSAKYKRSAQEALAHQSRTVEYTRCCASDAMLSVSQRCTTCGRAPRPLIRSRAAYRNGRHRRMAVCAAKADAPAEVEASANIEESLRVLRAAVATKQVPPADVLQAMLKLEKAKVKLGQDWAEILGGSQSPGRRWRLVFTSGTKEVQSAMKGLDEGHGKYFPVTAVQRWDATKSEIENGIIFGHIAALTFRGPYVIEGRRLFFDFDKLFLKLGPKTFEIPIKQKIDASSFKPSKDLPFFIFAYADEKMIVARGRSGGLAVWERTSPSWELKNGIV